jgi:hypothetical protein
MMIPPTPTPIPPDIGNAAWPEIGIPSMWNLAPEAVQTWNQFGTFGQVLQAMIICFLIGFTIWILWRFFKRLNDEGTVS